MARHGEREVWLEQQSGRWGRECRGLSDFLWTAKLQAVLYALSPIITDARKSGAWSCCVALGQLL